jgi:hypothetical protein
MQGYIDLTGTENDAIDLLWVVDGLTMFGVWNDPLELRVTSKFFNRGSCERMAEKRLGEKDDESCRVISKLSSFYILGCLRLRNCLFICLLRMWNRLAGVVMFAICMLQSWC